VIRECGSGRVIGGGYGAVGVERIDCTLEVLPVQRAGNPRAWFVEVSVAIPVIKLVSVRSTGILQVNYLNRIYAPYVRFGIRVENASLVVCG
jgi:hypothetical protein